MKNNNIQLYAVAINNIYFHNVEAAFKNIVQSKLK